ncbi:MAG TPA: asparaginase [Pyrinomonadaceae bacterium]|jgi:L-asparaginase II|nr:asparaginase [Pyrinomonadaceae bacterium]
MRETENVQAYPQPEPLVLVTRGSFVESVHAGHLAAVEGDGRTVASVGSPDAVSFMRSATKPFQALPLVTSGAADRFRFDARELAVACGSHNGETVHTETVLSMLSKTGLSVSDLKCGAHEPYSHEAAASLRGRGEKPSALHNNCSGKHAGMLALALHLGAKTSAYERPDNPAQRAVFRAVSHFSGVGENELRFATDGCGVPTFALTVRTMALMFARFVAGAGETEDVTPEAPRGVAGANAARRIIDSVLAHPDMVEGDGELDTELMRAGAGRLISKVGAEGVYCAGVLPCERWPRGLGLAFKIEDGDKTDRARPRVAVEALRQLGVLGEVDSGPLSKFARHTLKNHRGDRVGVARPSFTLSRA